MTILTLKTGLEWKPDVEPRRFVAEFLSEVSIELRWVSSAEPYGVSDKDGKVTFPYTTVRLGGGNGAWVVDMPYEKFMQAWSEAVPPPGFRWTDQQVREMWSRAEQLAINHADAYDITLAGPARAARMREYAIDAFRRMAHP